MNELKKLDSILLTQCHEKCRHTLVIYIKKFQQGEQEQLV